MQGWDNATLIARKDLTGDSAIFRIEADAPLFEFLAGQYTTIGLPTDTARIEGADPDESANGNPRKRIIRAYSIASSSKARDHPATPCPPLQSVRLLLPGTTNQVEETSRQA